MSVPKHLRSKSKLEVIIKAKELHKHTLLLTQNEKKFKVCYAQLIRSICQHSENIFINCYLSNDIFSKTAEAKQKRIELQTSAIAECNSLLALIDIAYSLFHLRGKSVEYWASLVIDESKDKLERHLSSITERLSLIGFETNKKKTRIIHIDNGIEFLGFNYRLTKTGKILMFVRTESVKREKRHLNKQFRKGMPIATIRDSLNCWLNHISKGNAYNVKKKMLRYYKEKESIYAKNNQIQPIHWRKGKNRQRKRKLIIERGCERKKPRNRIEDKGKILPFR